MTYLEDNAENWKRTTNGRPVKIGKDAYFVKTRTCRKKLMVLLPIQMTEELKLNLGEVYTVRMKEIETGRVHNTTLRLKRNPNGSELNRWPMCSYIPADCDVPTGCKLYAKITAVNLEDWFNSDAEVSPEEMAY